MRAYVVVTVFAGLSGFAGLEQAAQLLSPGLPIRVRETNAETLVR
jgi:hypothetical protein